MADKWTDSSEAQTLKGKVKQAFREPEKDDSYARAIAYGAWRGARMCDLGPKSRTSLGAVVAGVSTAIALPLMVYDWNTAQTIHEEQRPAPLVTAATQPVADVNAPEGFMLQTRVNNGDHSYEYVLTRDASGAYGLYSINHSLCGAFLPLPCDGRLEAVQNIENAAFASHVIAQGLSLYSDKLNTRDRAISPNERPSLNSVGTLSIPYDYDFTPYEDDVRYIIHSGDTVIRAGQDVSDQYARIAQEWRNAAAYFESGQMLPPQESDPRPVQTVQKVEEDYSKFASTVMLYGAVLGGQLTLLLIGAATHASMHRDRRKPRKPVSTGPDSAKPTP